LIDSFNFCFFFLRFIASNSFAALFYVAFCIKLARLHFFCLHSFHWRLLVLCYVVVKLYCEFILLNNLRKYITYLLTYL